jgi:hypothetical protein
MPPAESTPARTLSIGEIDRERMTAMPQRGMTPNEVALRYRVSPDKVREWIRRGALRAINVADVKCGKPRFVVPPEAIAEFERVRAAAEPPKPARRRRQPAVVDYFPD